MRASGGADDAGPGDPWEVFSALALLIVEGRNPGGDKGYHAGPHCPTAFPAPHKSANHHHVCNSDNPECTRACALLRQLRVMWGVGVGVSMEVLVAPECEHGAQLAATLDTAAAPRPSLKLIEQWNFAINHNRSCSSNVGGWPLVAAVRSFLHFSQLSAWLSRSEGRRPPNVLYRLTVTSPVFCSKFQGKSEEHVFPLASVGAQTSIQVSVKSLPRTDVVPIAVCPEKHGEILLREAQALSGSCAASTHGGQDKAVEASARGASNSGRVLPAGDDLPVSPRAVEVPQTSSTAASGFTVSAPRQHLVHVSDSQSISSGLQGSSSGAFGSSGGSVTGKTLNSSRNFPDGSKHLLSEFKNSVPSSSFSTVFSGSSSKDEESMNVSACVNKDTCIPVEKAVVSLSASISARPLPSGACAIGVAASAGTTPQSCDAMPATLLPSHSRGYDPPAALESSCRSSQMIQSVADRTFKPSVSSSFLASNSVSPSAAISVSSILPSSSPSIPAPSSGLALLDTSIPPSVSSSPLTSTSPSVSASPSVSKYESVSVSPSSSVSFTSLTSTTSVSSPQSLSSPPTSMIPPSSSCCSSSAVTSSVVSSSLTTSPLNFTPFARAHSKFYSMEMSSPAEKNPLHHEEVASSDKIQAESRSPLGHAPGSSFWQPPLQPSAAETNGSSASSGAKPPRNDDLRVSLMKAALEESSSSSRGSSPDVIQLGESLLDPPHASRIPRCYQSPSRSGSPSRETPEHIICRPRHYSVSEIRISSSSGGAVNDSCRPIEPDLVISRSGSGTVPYNPMAWTQSRYPTHSAGLQQPSSHHHHHHTTPQNNYYSQHHQQTSPHRNQLHHQHTQQKVSSGPPVSHPPRRYDLDSHDESSDSGNHSVNESWENMRNLRGTESKHGAKPISDHSYASSLNLKQDQHKNDHHIKQKAELQGDIEDRQYFDDAEPFLGFDSRESPKPPDSDGASSRSAKLKLDLSSMGKEWVSAQGSLLPPDEWSPRSRNLLLQHLGSGGTKRKVDSWGEEGGLGAANKGRRKEPKQLICYNKNGNMCNENTSCGSSKHNFELTPKETLEILSVLHQRAPGLPSRPPRSDQSQKPSTYHCSPKYGKPYDRMREKTPLIGNENEKNGCSLLSYRSSRDTPDTESEGEDYEDDKKLQCDTPETQDDLNSCSDESPSSTNGVFTTSETARNKRTLSDDSPEEHFPQSIPESTNGSSYDRPNDNFTRQVATIGERVRRALTFDGADYDPASNGRQDGGSASSLKRTQQQPSLFRSLMKRSYQVSSDHTWSSCKQAKPDTVEHSEVGNDLNNFMGSNSNVICDEDQHVGEVNGYSSTTVSEVRPDSPGTILGDEEVADITSHAIASNSPISRGGTPTGPISIPSTSDATQRKPLRASLDSQSNSVFHTKTGLPLTSSPAPLRKSGSRFEYDSSLNSSAAIKRSISFHNSVHKDRNDDSLMHTSCDCDEVTSNGVCSEACRPALCSVSAPATVASSNLLGTFEECVLHGRLEPVSTVQGFKAEIAASGSFCPEHIVKPVTVFFYTLGDNDHFSSPYMGHVSLEKKGYRVPGKGTVQVTLLNPLGTVVKMFVVMYDLSDMPCNSRTFLRQRTLNMPVGASDLDPDAHQWLRYLIHLKFASSKSGKVYLHTDIRMLIFRKSDADAAALHKTGTPYELRSFTHGPTNPKYSPRK